MKNELTKFRVWDIKNKWFIFQENFWFDYNGHYISLTEVFQSPKKFTVQEFTGLKDIDGKEIYEGDILKAFSYFYVVKYGEFLNSRPANEELSFGYYTEETVHKYKYPLYPIVTVKVVGNIFENPEFLKK